MPYSPGILDGDVLVVDKSIGPRHGLVVVAIVNGEMFMRRLNRKHGHWVLDSENKDLFRCVSGRGKTWRFEAW